MEDLPLQVITPYSFHCWCAFQDLEGRRNRYKQLSTPPHPQGCTAVGIWGCRTQPLPAPSLSNSTQKGKTGGALTVPENCVRGVKQPCVHCSPGKRHRGELPLPHPSEKAGRLTCSQLLFLLPLAPSHYPWSLFTEHLYRESLYRILFTESLCKDSLSLQRKAPPHLGRLSNSTALHCSPGRVLNKDVNSPL